jgi:hypothetical protein
MSPRTSKNTFLAGSGAASGPKTNAAREAINGSISTLFARKKSIFWGFLGSQGGITYKNGGKMVGNGGKWTEKRRLVYMVII